MLDLSLAQIMHGRIPFAHLLEHIGYGLRNQDVSGIPAVHCPLRNVDAGSGNVARGIDVLDSIHRARMYSHTQLHLWPLPENAVQFQSAAHWGFYVAQKDQCHAIAGGQPNELIAGLGPCEFLSGADRFLQMT
jgi:hypothetical protein